MKFVRWLYHRIGQLACFAAAAVTLATDDIGGLDVAHAIAGAALLMCGLGLRALDIWQRIDDPSRE